MDKGKVELIPSEDVVVGKAGTWAIRYTVGEGGIPVGGGIRIAFEHGSDWLGRHPQVDKPDEPNYVTATATRARPKVNAGYVSHAAVVVVTVEDRPLKQGEVIEVILGDKSHGSPGSICQTISQSNCEIIVFEDTQGKGKFEKINPSPTLNVIPDKTVRLEALARSYNVRRQPLSLVIRAEDKYGNVDENYHGKVKILDQESETLLKEYQFTPTDDGVKKISDISFDSPGTKRLLIKDEENNFRTFSNPVVSGCTKDVVKIYWGQIHGHSILSDGLGTAQEYYTYARDKSNLDFSSLTDHGIWTDAGKRMDLDPGLLRHYLDDKAWKVTQAAAKEYNQPGKFITLLGYEWCSTEYGDKNVYFYDEEETPEYPDNPESLYRALKGRRAMIISHMMKGVRGSRCIDWNYFNQELERVVEICSFHGVREYAGNRYFKDDFAAIKYEDKQKGSMVQDALSRGYRMGIVGGSDDHSGKPGSDVRGILSCRINGLCAVIMRELTRQDLWEALYNRRCYATTGARIILHFTLNDFPMGSEIESSGDKRRICIRAHGTAKIDTIDVVKNNNTVHTHKGKAWDEEVEFTDAKDNDTDYYYVRVRQEDGQMAWSSPIWIKDGPRS